MTSNSDKGSEKWIRPVKDNPAGKVVADPDGNRWEWQSNDETSHLLKKLNNDALAIEKSDLHPALERREHRTAAPTAAKPSRRPLKLGARDAGGGFNPYDHGGKKPR
jgi:hypothetical protein